MKVLINRTDAIGDTLLSTPLAALIKKKHPNAKVAFLVSPRSGELIKLCQGIDDVFIFDPSSSSFINRYSQLKNLFNDYDCDTYFHLGGSFLPTFVAWALSIPYRGGLVSKVFSFLFLNAGLRQSRSQVKKHESEYNLDLAQSAGLFYDKNDLSSFRPTFNIDKDLVKKTWSDLPFSNACENKQVIMVHPGMSGHTLNWPGSSYALLINKLLEQPNFVVIITYTPSDAPYVDNVKKSVGKKENLFYLDGSKMGLVNFCHFMSGVDLVIAPSTGITHMANALKLKQIGLYSPIKVQSAKRWGPFEVDQNVRIFSPQKALAREDFSDEDSMATIDVKEVFMSCLELLGKDV